MRNLSQMPLRAKNPKMNAATAETPRNHAHAWNVLTVTLALAHRTSAGPAITALLTIAASAGFVRIAMNPTTRTRNVATRAMDAQTTTSAFIASHTVTTTHSTGIAIAQAVNLARTAAIAPIARVVAKLRGKVSAEIAGGANPADAIAGPVSATSVCFRTRYAFGIANPHCFRKIPSCGISQWR